MHEPSWLASGERETTTARAARAFGAAARATYDGLDDIADREGGDIDGSESQRERRERRREDREARHAGGASSARRRRSTKRRVFFPPVRASARVGARARRAVPTRGGDARRDPRRAIRAYRRWLTRTRQARRRVGRARDLPKRVSPRRESAAAGRGVAREKKNRTTREETIRVSRATTVTSPLAMARRRSRKLRRATWFAQDIAFLLALRTLKAISWVHGKVHLGVRRLRANAR